MCHHEITETYWTTISEGQTEEDPDAEEEPSDVDVPVTTS
jgi:hypothetical protein